MTSIKAKLKGITFSKDNYAIFYTEDRLTVKGNTGLFTPRELIGLDIELTGDWDETSKYGKQFKFDSVKVVEDETFYILYRKLGIRRSVAKEIAQKHGDAFFDILESKKVDILTSIKGINPKNIEKLLTRWNEYKYIHELEMVLSPANVSSNLVKRIKDHFGSFSKQIIEENPYRIVEVAGIGFTRADEIAQKLGVPRNSPFRLQACAEYVIRQKMDNEGNSAIASLALVSSMIETLVDAGDQDVDGELCFQSVKRLIGERKFSFIVGNDNASTDDRIKNNEYISNESMIRKERKILSSVRAAYHRGNVVNDIDQWISNFETRAGKDFGDEQRDAIRLANTLPGIFSISGYAGSGKTTTSKAILDLVGMQFKRDEIVCCALAGIAANRVKMQSGFESGTIHSILGFDGEKFQYNASNKLPYKLVLLDEGSMVDSAMMSALFDAIDFNKTIMIILGDPAQLSPVGAGSPYSDMLKHELIPNVTLTRIYRQDESKMITTLAGQVRKGEMPDITKKYDDFEFSEYSMPTMAQLRKTKSEEEALQIRDVNRAEIKAKVLEIAKTHKSKMIELIKSGNYWEFITRFQVAAPTKKGPLGTSAFNDEVQSVINPDPPAQFKFVGTTHSRTFGVGDKVVHLRNSDMEYLPYNGKIPSYLDDDIKEQKRVFNGQLGVVVAAKESGFDVLYPIEKIVVSYKREDVSENMVDLAYALTVHKTQGSEFHSVAMPITNEHFSMLNPKLMYTAMTRAKEKLDIVGQKLAMQYACKIKDDHTKTTCIDLWLKMEKGLIDVTKPVPLDNKSKEWLAKYYPKLQSDVNFNGVNPLNEQKTEKSNTEVTPTFKKRMVF